MSDMEKTEAPTPKRRQDAREEGRIARSQELGTAVLMIASAWVLGSAGPRLGTALTGVMGSGLAALDAPVVDAQAAATLLQETVWMAAAGTMPLLLALTATAAVVGAAQARGVVSTKALAPKWERIDPLSHAKRMLGAQPWIDLLKSILKLVIVGMAVRGALAEAWSDVLALGQLSPFAMLQVVKDHAHRLMMNAGLAYLGLAAADYGWQLWQHEKQLRMSREDVKQEMKQSEGDPLLRARMRSAGRALARKMMLADVPRADVVITNPTHIAVAIKYDPEKAPAPYVLAIGQRKVAERIKAAAREAGVPMVENRPLARALLASAQVGTMIPPELYVAVAEVLAFVMRQRGRALPGGAR
jgi:flagellar biosynthetic protein FlhB